MTSNLYLDVTEDFSVYINKGNSYEEKRQSERVNISKYFPTFMIELSKQLENFSEELNDKFLICPIYRNEEIQIGITGKSQGNEDQDQALFREIQEETTLEILTLEIFCTEVFDKSYGCIALGDFQSEPIESGHLGENKQQVGVFLFTTNFPHVNVFDIKSDNIKGVAMIRYQEVLHIIRELMESMKEKTPNIRTDTWRDRFVVPRSSWGKWKPKR